MTFNVVDHLCEKKTPDFLETKLIWEGRVGVGIAVGARVIGSEVVFWGIFRNVPSHNTGTTRGPQQFPRFSYFILDNNSSVQYSKSVSFQADFLDNGKGADAERCAYRKKATVFPAGVHLGPHRRTSSDLPA